MGRNKYIMEIKKKQEAVAKALAEGSLPVEEAEGLQFEFDSLLIAEDERHRIAAENFKKSAKKWRKNISRVIRRQSI